MLLSDLKPGMRARITCVKQGAGKRLAALGFVPGTAVEAAQPAPGGDPAVYRLRGSLMAIRRSAAMRVEVVRE